MIRATARVLFDVARMVLAEIALSVRERVARRFAAPAEPVDNVVAVDEQTQAQMNEEREAMVAPVRRPRDTLPSPPPLVGSLEWRRQQQRSDHSSGITGEYFNYEVGHTLRK